MDQILFSTREKLAADFGAVDTWVFDLDNTLYPHHANLWEQVDNRITTWIADYYGVDGLTARALQKYYYQRYGTSLRGLMVDEGLDPAGFLDFAHDIDHSRIEADPLLGTALRALPGRKLIFTSGTVNHALNIVRKLEITEHFGDVFDIVAADYLPKPAVETYDRFFGQHGVDPSRAAMFEDLSRNLIVPHARGMRTILVVPHAPGDILREDWELQGRYEPHVDYVTDDLPAFVDRLAEALAA
ncbi:pyrimidine 5'-nucleotidase [Labrys monachus]|uniref:Hydrolase of the HAD superfamily n=1 Tax=Labrys monachus TaxID=217067 RepID=A0ABU0FEJ1_9HYPH|nr:pyrimidine 5'-nucleotidase [Labrys monachus]MDQ0392549.1 putative hydrolase of the HAD superfamily [Labrys monachus]